MSSKVKTIWQSARFKGLAAIRKLKQSATGVAGWFSRGKILTTAANVYQNMKDTFANATHDGAVSSGLVRCFDKELVAYLSDIDGNDSIDDFQSYVNDLKSKYPDMSPPVKVFSASGVLGMYARTNMTYVMIYGGIPYIIPIHRELDGTDEHDAEFSNTNNRIVQSMSNRGCNHVVSLGFVDDTVNVNEYVLNYAKKSPLFDSNDLDYNVVLMAIQSDKIHPIGSLYFPGGALYDIYVLEPLYSKTFRTFKDFTKPNETFPAGKEVMLVGGDPEIVYVGTQAAPNGLLLDVWVPNTANNYNRAAQIVANGLLPLGTVVADDDELLESYAILMKMLREMDEEMNGPAPDDTIPDMIVGSDEDTDTDEIPVLLELP